MATARKTLPAVAPDNIVPLVADEAKSAALPAEQAKPPHCKVSGTVERGRKVMLKLDQAPGAVLATFGDRTDTNCTEGAYKLAGPFTHMIIEAFVGVANGKLPEDMEGDLPASGVNALIQAMAAFAPADELEGMIAAQAVAMHQVTMDSIVRAQRSDRSEFRQQHLSAANKSSRTFAALIETLNRHRGKTTTQKFVFEQVNVAPGAQAVVGAVSGGAGPSKRGAERAHAQTEAEADAGSPILTALPCPDPRRETVSAAGDEEQGALPHARRRTGKRRATGKSERAEARSLQRGGNRDAANGAGAHGTRAKSAGMKGPANER